jgi:hypothetical protein
MKQRLEITPYDRKRRRPNSHNEALRAALDLLAPPEPEVIAARLQEYESLRLCRRMWQSAWARSREFGLSFNLRIEDIRIPEKCPALGIPLQRGKGKWSPNSPSLDRLIPQLGYVKGNVRVISMRANGIKSNATVEEFCAVADWFKQEVEKSRMAKP